MRGVAATLVVFMVLAAGGAAWLNVNHMRVTVSKPSPQPRRPAAGSVHICENANYDGSTLSCMNDDRNIYRADLNQGASGPALVIEAASQSINPNAVVRLFKVDVANETDADGFTNITLNQIGMHTALLLKPILDDALSNASNDGGPTTLQDGATYVVRVDSGSALVFGGEVGSTTFLYHAH